MFLSYCSSIKVVLPFNRAKNKECILYTPSKKGFTNFYLKVIKLSNSKRYPLDSYFFFFFFFFVFFAVHFSPHFPLDVFATILIKTFTFIRTSFFLLIFFSAFHILLFFLRLFVVNFFFYLTTINSEQ